MNNNTKNNMDHPSNVALARELFLAGYNCAQSVAGAFWRSWA